MIVKEQYYARSRILAEAAAIERLLNSYMRENGISDPCPPDESLFEALPEELSPPLEAHGKPFQLALPASEMILLGAITHFSPTGHHQFGDAFWIRSMNGSCCRPVGHIMTLADLLITEIASGEPNLTLRIERQQRLLRQIENSIERTALYVERYLERDTPHLDVEAADRFLMAEQRLLFGHPFHPTPKSAEGFSLEDLARYAPEMGASFNLDYFAVAPAYGTDSFLTGTGSSVIPGSVQEAAREWLGADYRRWRLLPCHPWQADYLCRLPAVADAMAAGQLQHLGPLGRPVFPTSSVRTVWVPEHDHFFKLPLNVRITHFFRINPLDQLQRSLDASRAVAAVAPSFAWERFSLFQEAGYRTIRLPGLVQAAQDDLAACFGVIFRTAPDSLRSKAPMVVASLLEPPVGGGVPPVVEAIHRAAERAGQAVLPALVADWFHRYLEISLLPILELFLEAAISLEAHTQNSLLALKDGWPDHFYVRDLEGTSIGRERTGEQLDWLDRESPVLYDDAYAWHRLKYYFFVNHLGQFISTLARYTPVAERQLWEGVRTLLGAANDRFPTNGSGSYLEELLGNPSLPAKANLISRFKERGETPVYVPIPTPFHPIQKKDKRLNGNSC